MFNTITKYSLTLLSIFAIMFSVVISITSYAVPLKQNLNSMSDKNQKKFKLEKIIQPESDLVEIIQDQKTKKTKKNLIKPIALEFTSTNIEKNMTKKQKEAILLALKKWKLKMPFDNKFTVTGILPAGDSFVVYMMASTPNPNFNPNIEYTNEDFETNDLRFIDTSFNILLKNKNNSSWKAILAEDSSEINEIIDLSEKSLDNVSKDKLFGTKKPENKFTELEDVITENAVSSSSNSLSSISSSSSQTNINSSTTSSYSSISTIQSLSSNVNSASSVSFQNTISSGSSSSKTFGLLDILFNSPRVSAGDTDYSWPWKNGETWSVNSGNQYNSRSGYKSDRWHAKTEESGETVNRGLDIMVPSNYWNSANGNWNDIPVLAPKTGTITQVCTLNGTGGDNYFMRIDDMYIWHMTPNNNFIVNATVKKGDQIGTVATGSNRSGNIGQTGTFSTKCGSGSGAHLHIRFVSNNMVIDNTTLTWENDNYSSFTSQNQSTQPYNNYNSQVWPQDNNNFRIEVAGGNTADQSRVKLWTYNGSLAQRWGYDFNTRQIKGLNDKCLDAGDVNNPNNRWLRISTCHNGANQKWFIDNVGRIHTDAKTSLCIDSPQGNAQGSDLYMGECHNGNNQKWTGNLPMNVQETFFPIRLTSNNNYGFDIWGGPGNGTAIKLGQIWGGNNQQWEYNSTSQQIRSKDGRCVDAGDINNSNNRWIRINSCHNGQSQKFYPDSYSRLHSNANGNLCIDSASGDVNGSMLYMGTCHYGNNQKWWVQGWLS